MASGLTANEKFADTPMRQLRPGRRFEEASVTFVTIADPAYCRSPTLSMCNEFLNASCAEAGEP